ncbi:hypothetical protein EYF80_050603 [Liparis tanakae]|uniref:Uncharacterized protein n=1 Tax=Liparis tanakae TaxID=230148 RepID=A0A4Z2FDK2_9TELE|nr:hypothetical protein EYF80_050603 [Liparis tanakae]
MQQITGAELTEVADEAGDVDEELGVGDEEAVDFGHVGDVLHQRLGVVGAEQAVAVAPSSVPLLLACSSSHISLGGNSAFSVFSAFCLAAPSASCRSASFRASRSSFSSPSPFSRFFSFIFSTFLWAASSACFSACWCLWDCRWFRWALALENFLPQTAQPAVAAASLSCCSSDLRCASTRSWKFSAVTAGMSATLRLRL